MASIDFFAMAFYVLTRESQRAENPREMTHTIVMGVWGKARHREILFPREGRLHVRIIRH